MTEETKKLYVVNSRIAKGSHGGEWGYIVGKNYKETIQFIRTNPVFKKELPIVYFPDDKNFSVTEIPLNLSNFFECGEHFEDLEELLEKISDKIKNLEKEVK
jgi:hypothetical protein